MRQFGCRWIAAIVLFVLAPTQGVAQIATKQSQPCTGISMMVASNAQAKISELNASVAEIKARLAAGPDAATERDLKKRLEDLQKELLDLVFARECARTDFTIQVLRGDNDGAPQQWLEITTFFGTNRKPTGNPSPSGFYGSDRQQPLQFGKAVVSIPTNRKPGTMELPSLWKLEFSADPSKHFIFKAVTPLETDAARAEMAKILAAGSKKSLLVFVHGYNVEQRRPASRGLCRVSPARLGQGPEGLLLACDATRGLT